MNALPDHSRHSVENFSKIKPLRLIREPIRLNSSPVSRITSENQCEQKLHVNHFRELEGSIVTPINLRLMNSSIRRSLRDPATVSQSYTLFLTLFKTGRSLRRTTETLKRSKDIGTVSFLQSKDQLNELIFVNMIWQYISL